MKDKSKMKTVRIKGKIGAGRELHLENLPFVPGQEVEVTVEAASVRAPDWDAAPLAGTVIKYVDPTLPVAAEG
jgi:hypothetical protein